MSQESAMDEELTNLRAEVAELRSQKAALESQLAELKIMTTDLGLMVNDATKERDMAKSQLAACTTSHQKRNAELAALEDQLAEARGVIRSINHSEYWYWQGDDEDHIESITCPIIITPHKLREAIDAGALRAKPEA